tara:strand:- start:12 stop:1604 length:1593 start_codon:yes stop_codon:yes gene_type:complete
MSTFDFDIAEELCPIKGFTKADVARKEYAQQIASTQREQRKYEPVLAKQQRARDRENRIQSAPRHQDVRKFHNTIKNGLYDRGYSYAGLEDDFAGKPPQRKGGKEKFRRKTLLELSCGRGGDMHKWKNTGYTNVVGVDYDPAAIDNARDRVKKTKMPGMRIDFGQMNLCQTEPTIEARLLQLFPKSPWSYDTVSIQFAIQYMCETPEILGKFLCSVASLVRPGGTFIGTFPDGSEILKLLGQGTTFDNGFLKLEEDTTQGKPRIKFFADFGSSSDASYFREFGTSVEYPVNWKEICTTMESYGFELIEHRPFLEYSERDAFFLQPEEEQFSGIFKTFIFRKHPNTAFFPSIPNLNWSNLQIDKVGKYSITRPQDAGNLHNAIVGYYQHLSGGYWPTTVCDGTACVGGDTIQFAMYAQQVFAWETDPVRYGNLENNIRVYNLQNVVTQNLSFRMSQGTCDVLYLDPPWGGPGYDRTGARVELYLDSINIKQIILEVRDRFRMVAIKIPHNYNIPPDSRVVPISSKMSVWFP